MNSIHLLDSPSMKQTNFGHDEFANAFPCTLYENLDNSNSWMLLSLLFVCSCLRVV